jgi:hypothetical protein
MIFQASGRQDTAHISGAVVAFPVSGLRLNCCFLIFSASSMPRIVIQKEKGNKVVTLYEIRRLASHCPSRESLLLVQFSIALKEEIVAL